MIDTTELDLKCKLIKQLYFSIDNYLDATPPSSVYSLISRS